MAQDLLSLLQEKPQAPAAPTSSSGGLFSLLTQDTANAAPAQPAQAQEPTAPYTFEENLREGASRVIGGAYAGLGALGKFVGDPGGIGTALEKRSQVALEPIHPRATTFADKVLQGAGSAIPFLAGGEVAGAVGLGAKAITGTMAATAAAQSGTQAFYGAKSEGKSDQDAWISGLANAGLGGLATSLGSAAPAMSKLIAGVAKTDAETGGSLKKALINTASGAFQQGYAMSAQELGSVLVENLQAKTKAERIGLRDALTRAAETFGVSAPLGAVFSAAAELHNAQLPKTEQVDPLQFKKGMTDAGLAKATEGIKAPGAVQPEGVDIPRGVGQVDPLRVANAVESFGAPNQTATDVVAPYSTPPDLGAERAIPTEQNVQVNARPDQQGPQNEPRVAQDQNFEEANARYQVARRTLDVISKVSPNAPEMADKLASMTGPQRRRYTQQFNKLEGQIVDEASQAGIQFQAAGKLAMKNVGDTVDSPEGVGRVMDVTGPPNDEILTLRVPTLPSQEGSVQQADLMGVPAAKDQYRTVQVKAHEASLFQRAESLSRQERARMDRIARSREAGVANVQEPAQPEIAATPAEIRDQPAPAEDLKLFDLPQEAARVEPTQAPEAPAEPQAPRDLPPETAYDRYVKSGANDLRRVDKLEKTFGDVGLGRAAREMPGREFSQKEFVQETYKKPMLAAAKLGKLSVDESTFNPKDRSPVSLDDWLAVQGADQRNATLFAENPALDPNVKPASGTDSKGNPLTPKRIQEIKALALGSRAAPQYQAIADILPKLNDFKLSQLVDSGFYSQDWRNAVEARYGPNWTSLKTIFEDPAIQGTGGGGVAGSAELYKSVKGRSTAANQVAAQLFHDVDVAIGLAQRTKVQALVPDLLKNLPEAGRVLGPGEEPSHEAVAQGRVFNFRQNGESMRAEIADMPLARALKRLDNHGAGIIDDHRIALVRAYNALMHMRYWAIIKASAFPMRNLPKDAQHAAYTLAQMQGMKVAAEYAKTFPQAVLASRRLALDPNAAGPIEDQIRLLRENGGYVGWRDEAGIRETNDSIKHDVEGPQNLKERIADATYNSKVAQAWYRTGEYVEQGTRSAVGVAMLNSGKSVPQAVEAMRFATVDWGQRGNWQRAMNGWQNFLSARVKAGVQYVETVKASPLRRILAVHGSLFAAGYLMAKLSHLYGDTDQNGTETYDSLPWYKKATRMGVTWGKWLIGMPISMPYNLPYFLGVLTEGMERGVIKPSEAIAQFTNQFVDAASPMTIPVAVPTKGQQASDVAKSIAAAVVPDPLKPLVEMGVNQNFTGGKVYPESDYHPDAYSTWNNTSHWLASFSEWLNEHTGGDKHAPGTISIAPDAIAHMIDGVTGVDISSGMKGLEGIITRTMHGHPPEITPNDLPLVRSFVSGASPAYTSQLYRDNARDVRNAYARSQEGAPLAAEERSLAGLAFKGPGQKSSFLSGIESDIEKYHAAMNETADEAKKAQYQADIDKEQQLFNREVQKIRKARRNLK